MPNNLTENKVDTKKTSKVIWHADLDDLVGLIKGIIMRSSKSPLVRNVRTMVHFFLFLMDNLKSRTTELLATLGRRVGEIMGNSSELGVLKDGRVETELLHKARMRIAVQLRQCLESPGDNLTFNDGSISEYEINQAALTIAHAMFNPMNVDWNVDQYVDKAKLSPPNLDGSPTAQMERLKKFFPEVKLSKISVPITIVDRHGKNLVVYLPNILTPSGLVCFWLGIPPQG
ncbi:hypothetical protein BDR05DRAFT_952325 [Suillus weaverae]|nr:hypothetical protein BDR05DRAFT_952325 [Suillus weaverae]